LSFNCILELNEFGYIVLGFTLGLLVYRIVLQIKESNIRKEVLEQRKEQKSNKLKWR